jgi:hypothetical protein
MIVVGWPPLCSNHGSAPGDCYNGDAGNIRTPTFIDSEKNSRTHMKCKKISIFWSEPTKTCPIFWSENNPHENQGVMFT